MSRRGREELSSSSSIESPTAKSVKMDDESEHTPTLSMIYNIISV